jgi:hypothetical protein
MEQMFSDRAAPRTGRLAFGSATTLLYYESLYYESASGAGADRQTHLELQRVTGGTAARTRVLPGPLADGDQALGLLADEKWLTPTEGGSQPDATPEDLIPVFRTMFPTGALVDLLTLEGVREMRELDRQLLAETLPAAMRCLTDGTTMALVHGRWMTPIYDGGVLRLVCFVPSEPDPERLKSWRAALRSWQLSRLPVASSVGALT